MSLRLSSPPPRSSDPSARGTSSARAFWKLDHLAMGRSGFERMVFSVAVALVQLGIVKNGRWWLLPRRNLAQDFSILFQECIDHLDHLACHTTNHFHFPAVGLPSFIEHAFPWDQPFIQLGPLRVWLLDQIAHHQVHRLFHRPC